MKLTLSYSGYYGHTFEEFVREANDLGFSGVQFIPDQTPNLIREFDGGRLKDLRRLIKERHLALSIHAIFYDINLVSVVPEVQDFALSMLQSNFEFARSLGARAITVHPGYMFPGWRSSPLQEGRFWQSAIRGIQALDKLAQESGVQAFLENGSYYVSSKDSQRRVPLHIGITVEEIQRLIDGTSDSVGVCLDVGKALVSGVGVSPFLRQLGERIGQVQIATSEHLNDLTSDPYFSSLRNVPEFVFEGGRDRASEFIRSESGKQAG